MQRWQFLLIAGPEVFRVVVVNRHKEEARNLDGASPQRAKIGMEVKLKVDGGFGDGTHSKLLYRRRSSGDEAAKQVRALRHPAGSSGAFPLFG